ncbi:hypothetical protein LZ31DRAFT_254191 [Colletotrichum somersetense]|nr:hypothetical protein LZ31DRAFT_254191 [Colletotrichum somersetense]
MGSDEERCRRRGRAVTVRIPTTGGYLGTGAVRQVGSVGRHASRLGEEQCERLRCHSSPTDPSRRWMGRGRTGRPGACCVCVCVCVCSWMLLRSLSYLPGERWGYLTWAWVCYVLYVSVRQGVKWTGGRDHWYRCSVMQGGVEG